MLRGGSWNNNPDNCRSANRNRNARDNRNNNVGFRVVCAASCTLLSHLPVWAWLVRTGRCESVGRTLRRVQTCSSDIP
ncbi:SUMF1/EgtB/PvdO family nonheme iron enzyme [Congregibacter sp.]|uniref:SUMF1/EgtB/PvdO family nonheme iron enzyme n=1 Tax=Congregibacter sp. TaxID=2744308 RepID=UPI00385E6309